MTKSIWINGSGVVTGTHLTFVRTEDTELGMIQVLRLPDGEELYIHLEGDNFLEGMNKCHLCGQKSGILHKMKRIDNTAKTTVCDGCKKCLHLDEWEEE